MHTLLRLSLTLGVMAALTGLIWQTSRPKPIAVLLKSVDRGQVEETLANTRAGTVKPCRRARLSPAIGGQIAVLKVREGQQVKQGDLLLELWNLDLQAEADLAVGDTRAAQAQTNAACLSAEAAQREATRLKRLRHSGAASEEATDQATSTAAAKRAECEAAQAKIQVSAAKERVTRAQLDRTRLRAPFDAVVAEITGELSEFVTPSPIGIPTPPVVDLVDNSCFFVSAPIDEVDAPKVRPGLPARIHLDAFAGRSFEGRVRRVADYVLDIEKQARTLEVEVEFSETEDFHQLLAGYSADVEIILGVSPDTLRLPTETLVERQRVYLFHQEDGRLESRPVTIGRSNWEYTEVLSGVSAGDRLVSSIDRPGVADGALAEIDTKKE